MTSRVNLDVMDYGTERKPGPIMFYFHVPGEKDDNGQKAFREIVSGPNVRAIMAEIGSDIGVDDRMPVPTHILGEPYEGDLTAAILSARDRWM